jgi:RND family efflux transporter MFP subunit
MWLGGDMDDARRARRSWFRGALGAGARWLPALVAAGLVLPGCAKRAPAPPPPVVAVTVAHPVEREVVEWDQYTGRLDAVDTVDVRARVSGLVLAAPFEEGALVQAGAVLFEIDARPFQADLDNKLALVAQAQAQITLAQITFKRMSDLLKVGAATHDEYDSAAAALQQAQAALEAAKAAAETARLNVDWCHVTAPITGRISRKYVTRGNLINGGMGQAALLTTIVSVDPIYGYFEVDEQSILKYQLLVRDQKVASTRDGQVPCFLQLANESGYPHQGRIDFQDNRIDPATGTKMLRAVFANPDGWLMPGFFAHVRVPGSAPYRALLVPDAALGTDQNQKFLTTVGADGTVAIKVVTPGALFGTLRAISRGIGADDRVIINGQMQARPGMKVQAQPGVIAPALLPVTDAPLPPAATGPGAGAAP